MNVEVGATQHTAASSPQRSWLVVAGIARPVTVQAVVPRERDARDLQDRRRAHHGDQRDVAEQAEQDTPEEPEELRTGLPGGYQPPLAPR